MAKRTKSRISQEDVADRHYINESDDELNDELSEQFEAPVRSPKRARTNPLKAKSRSPRRRKRDGSQTIMKMPMEVLAQINSYLAPGDLVALVLTNKFFRATLLQRSARPIWQCALKHVPYLPPCLTGMSEPQYAALLFSKYCTLCGASATAKPDPFLRARLCANCRDTKLEPVPAVIYGSLKNYFYVPKSEFIKPKVEGRRYYGARPFCFRGAAEELSRRRNQFLEEADMLGLEIWQQELEATMDRLNSEGGILLEYINSLGTSRSSQLHRVRMERREAIYERLRARGWEDKEFRFDPELYSSSLWYDLVWVTEPLTEEDWVQMLPQLEPLLEQNRAHIQGEEEETRQTDRLEKINDLLCQLKRDAHPYQSIVDALDLIIPDYGDTEYDERKVLPNPFPDTADTLEWGALEDLCEEDISLEEVEELFHDRREEIEREVARWRVEIEDQLVEQYGADLQGNVIVKVRGTTKATKHLSRNARFLLRADTVFKLGQTSRRIIYSGYDLMSSTVPYHFPHIISSFDDYYPSLFRANPYAKSSEPERYERHSEMEDLVKALLKSMKMPDVAYIELASMGEVFACGRCEGESSGPGTWANIVAHYHEALRKWDQFEELYSSQATRQSIIFRNVHDLKSANRAKPLLRILSASESGKMISGATCSGPQSTCLLCDSVQARYDAPWEWMKDHLLGMHEVSDPIEDVHYSTDIDEGIQTDSQAEEW